MSEGYGLVQIKSGNTLYDFGTIMGITDTLNKAITSIPIVTLPTDSTFALESNTSNRFTISFARKNPLRFNPETQDYETYESDEDYYRTSWKWTNELWIEATSSLLNRWQVRTDGYKLYINVKNIEESIFENHAVFEEITNLFPTYQGVNVYLADLSYTLSAGHTEFISGSMSVVIGGRLTEKLSVDESSDLVAFDQFEQDQWTQGYTNGKYIQIGQRDGRGGYNYHNEYNDYIETSKSRIYITALDVREGRVLMEEEFPLTIGAPYNLDSTKRYDWNYDYSNNIDLVSSYTLQGGVESPFEKLVLKMSKRAFARTYKNIGISLTDGDNTDDQGYRARIIPGLSKIRIKAVGYGTYVVAETSLSNNVYTITAYCEAEAIRGIMMPPQGHVWASPMSAILDILTNSDWGLARPFTADRIISNVSDLTGMDISSDQDKAHEYLRKRKISNSVWAVRSIGSTNMWVFLQACAYMLNAKIFFANDRAYIIDYTKLDKEIREDDAPPAPRDGRTKYCGNRLIIRSGLDRGMYPSQYWGIQDLSSCTSWEDVMQVTKTSPVDYVSKVNELNSLELHTENSLDRVAGRVYGTVSQDSQGTTTVYNTVYVKYNSVKPNGERYVKTLWFGANDRITSDTGGSVVDRFIGEWESDPVGEEKYKESHYPGKEYDLIKEVAKISIQRGGVSAYTLDLTPYFEVLPDEYARCALYAVLYYRAEPQSTIKFTLNERNSGTVNEDTTGYGDSYWSALFPIVCSAIQISDIEQELTVSAIGYYVSRYFPQKLALSKYTRDYPSGRTTYVFGVTNSIDLASSTSYIMTRTG